jgi:hypothetical protein
MNKLGAGFDYNRYRMLLAEATDEPKRKALIELLIAEGARGKLAAQTVSRRIADLPIKQPRRL